MQMQIFIKIFLYIYKYTNQSTYYAGFIKSEEDSFRTFY